jgi:hypothetical protein
VAHFPADLEVVAAVLDGQAVADVNRLRAPRHRQVRIVAERFVAGQDEHRVPSVRLRQRWAGDPERLEPVQPARERCIVASQPVPSDPDLVEHAVRQHQRGAGRGVLPDVQNGDAEPGQVAATGREWLRTVIGGEAVAKEHRVLTPRVVIGLDGQLEPVSRPER